VGMEESRWLETHVGRRAGMCYQAGCRQAGTTDLLGPLVLIRGEEKLGSGGRICSGDRMR
jgi:hypothetical protein